MVLDQNTMAHFENDLFLIMRDIWFEDFRCGCKPQLYGEHAAADRLSDRLPQAPSMESASARAHQPLNKLTT
jgi:hypothetical protein